MLTAYIERRIPADKSGEFISVNRLNLLFEDTDARTVLVNKIRSRMAEHVLLRLTELLRAEGIEPIHFKGLTLAYLLYDHPEQRIFGDVDFFVSAQDYSKALEVLLGNGFSVLDGFDGHHITLGCKDVSIEMHTSYFHPDDGIGFTVEQSGMRQTVINGHSLTTFDPTYQFLFLFLHYFTHAKKGGKYSDRTLLLNEHNGACVVELSRLYDVALLIERYGEEIDWQRCVSVLAPFRGCAEFRCALWEFGDAFPSVLPDDFLRALCSGTQSIQERFPIFYSLMSEPDRCYVNIMCDAVAHTSEMYTYCDAQPREHRFFVDEYDGNKTRSYVLSGIAPKGSADLSFKFDFWIADGKLWLTMDVTDDVLDYLSEGAFPEDDESIGYCDGFTLCVVPADGRYVFHRIYAFLTRNGEGAEYLSFYEIVNSPVALNGIVESTLKTDANGYTAKIGIPLEYLNLTDEDPSFYFNVIVSDSDDKKGCETALAIDPSPNAWDDCRTYPMGKPLIL